MSFASPAMLLGLLVIAAVAVLYALSRRGAQRGRAAFAAPAVQPALLARAPGARRHLPPLLYAVAGAVLVVALAHPQTTVAVPIEQATVILVTDHSRSMSALDIKPNRLAAARSAADKFLSQVPARVRVGSVSFNQRATLLHVPTTDRGAIRAGLNTLQPFGGTATGEGLGLGLAAARGPALAGVKPPPAAIILLTDGRSSSGRDPLAVARAAKQAGVAIHTVALGTATGTLSNGTSATSDEASLQAIAQLSGGHFSTAADAQQLQSVYRELGSRITTRKAKRDRTATFAGGGLLLLLAGAGLSLATFGRLP